MTTTKHVLKDVDFTPQGRFAKGNKVAVGNKGGGRKPGPQRQLLDEAKKHPDRVTELMDECYRMAIESVDERIRLEAMKYYIDRLKGRPKVSLGVAEEDRTLLTAAFLLELRKAVDTPLIEGEFKELKR